jgi:predicted SnoaL-like aldol condensation-catalyzing enzyme
MKNRPTNNVDKKKTAWRKAIAVGILSLLLVGIVVAINRDEVISFQAKVADNKPAGAAKSRPLVTRNADGQLVVVNQQTSQQRPLTPEEQRTLAEGIKQLVNRETDGLVQIEHANGMVSMDLQGRFQNVLLAKREADGTVSQSCVDNLDSAAAFFEIDPVLLGSAASKQQPVSSTPAIR